MPEMRLIAKPYYGRGAAPLWDIHEVVKDELDPEGSGSEYSIRDYLGHLSQALFENGALTEAQVLALLPGWKKAE